MNVWYIVKNNIKNGPYSAKQMQEFVRDGSLLPEMLVLKEGSPLRRKAKDAVFMSPGEQEAIAIEELQKESKTVIRAQNIFLEDKKPALIVTHSERVPAVEKSDLEKKIEMLEKQVENFKEVANKRLPLVVDQSEDTAHLKALELQPLPSQRAQPSFALTSELDFRDGASLSLQVPSLAAEVVAEPTPVRVGYSNAARAIVPPKAPIAHQLPNAVSEGQFTPLKGNAKPAWQRHNSTTKRGNLQQQNRNRPQEKSFLFFVILMVASIVSGACIFAAVFLKYNRVKAQREKVRVEIRSNTEPPVRLAVQPNVVKTEPKVMEFAPRDILSRKPVATPFLTEKPAQTAVFPRERVEKGRPRVTPPPVKIANTKKADIKVVIPKKPLKKERPVASKTTPIAKKRTPAGWPQPFFATGGEIKNKKFVTISLTGVSVDTLPQQCAPCRVSGRLHDGTPVLLVSSTLAPWSAARALNGTYYVKGFVQKNEAGAFWLLIQSVQKM